MKIAEDKNYKKLSAFWKENGLEIEVLEDPGQRGSAGYFKMPDLPGLSGELPPADYA